MGPVGVHTLRHTAAASMITNGAHLNVITDALGHSSTAITGDVYGHVAPGMAEEALDQLGATFAKWGCQRGVHPKNRGQV